MQNFKCKNYKCHQWKVSQVGLRGIFIRKQETQPFSVSFCGTPSGAAVSIGNITQTMVVNTTKQSWNTSGGELPVGTYLALVPSLNSELSVFFGNGLTPMGTHKPLYEPVYWHIYVMPNTSNMMTSSNGKIFRVTGPLCGEFTGPGEFPA